jgi:hypothetical protein
MIPTVHQGDEKWDEKGTGFRVCVRTTRICVGAEAHCRSLGCAPPDFLSRFMALMHFMRLSLRKGAQAALSSAAWQEIRVGMTKGEGGTSMDSGC